VKRLREWGAAGVGQSSWGPAVYAVVDGDDAALDLSRRAHAAMGDGGAIFTGAFPGAGARLTR